MEHVLEAHVGAKLRDDAGGHLMHGAIGLDGEEVRDLDRAELGDTAKIIAEEIHDHEVFRPLLLIHGEPGLEARILAGVRPRGAVPFIGRLIICLP